MANINTDLIEPDVHYWGNVVGETGNVPGNTSVNSGDISGVTNNFTNFLNPADILNNFDFNRDGQVDVGDRTIAVNTQTVFFNELKLITPPSPPVAPLSAEATQNLIAAAIDDLFANSEEEEDVLLERIFEDYWFE